MTPAQEYFVFEFSIFDLIEILLITFFYLFVKEYHHYRIDFGIYHY